MLHRLILISSMADLYPRLAIGDKRDWGDMSIIIEWSRNDDWGRHEHVESVIYRK